MSSSPPNDEAGPPSRNRRLSGPRVPVTEPVVVLAGPRKLNGWVLNIGAGGLRAALDGALEVDEHVKVFVGGDEATGRPARVAWVRARPDGTILGLAFTDVDPPVPPPQPQDDD